MAQAVAERVDVEQLRELLEGASAAQVKEAASAVEKLLEEQDKASMQKQMMALQYTCDEHHHLRLHVETCGYKFEGQGKGCRPASGASQECVPHIPECVYKETTCFFVNPRGHDRGLLVFCKEGWRPLYAALVAFESAPACGHGRWVCHAKNN